MWRYIMDKLYVVGLDLSLNGTGVCVIEAGKYSVKIIKEIFINNKHIKAEDRGHKLFNIYCNIDDTLQELKEKGIEPIVVTESGFSKHTKATQALYSVVGVVEMTMYCNNMSITKSYAPTSVKKQITGKGKASKQEVMEEVRQFLVSKQGDYVFQSEDTSDALAVAISYLLDNQLLEGGK